MASVAELRSSSTLSRGTSSREVRSGDPAAVGEVPHLDRTPPLDPKPFNSIISHTSAYGKIICFPAGQALRNVRHPSHLRPRVVRQAVGWGCDPLGEGGESPRPPALTRFRAPGLRPEPRPVFERFEVIVAIESILSPQH